MASFRRFLSENRLALLSVAACVVLSAAFLLLFYRTPGTRIGPTQPIAFSHRIHAGVKTISCRFCHPYVDRSLHPGLPAVEKCLFCHQYIIANHPEIQKEHWYFNSGTPTPWRKVFYLPEHVLFNHERHVKQQVQCAHCHGAVETMDRLKSQRFQMGFCVQCHRQRGAPLDCWLACHS